MHEVVSEASKEGAFEGNHRVDRATSLSEGGQSMEEMTEQDRQIGEVVAPVETHLERAARVVGLLTQSLWLLVFCMILRTGYLSWIGITVGVLYLMPGLAAPLAGLAGKRRLETLLRWPHTASPFWSRW